MADPIRPSNWPVVPSAPQRTDPRAAAQKAFFAMAMGQAPQEEAAPERPASQSRRPDLHIELPSEPPQTILRPGSIIDIRV